MIKYLRQRQWSSTKKIGKIAGEEISYKELLELRKKVKDLEEDNDILKNALAIFTSQREKNNEGIEKTAKKYKKTAKLLGIPQNSYYSYENKKKNKRNYRKNGINRRNKRNMAIK